MKRVDDKPYIEHRTPPGVHKLSDPRVRFPDARYATCRDCGQRWNISTKAVIGRSGYLCPRCREKYRRERD